MTSVLFREAISGLLQVAGCLSLLVAAAALSFPTFLLPLVKLDVHAIQLRALEMVSTQTDNFAC